MRGKILLVATVALVSANSLAAQAAPGHSGIVAEQPAQRAATVDAPARPADAPASAAERMGPSAAGAELLAPAPAQATTAREVTVPSRRRSDPGLALVIVGGALFLGGAIIGGDPGTALMVGGVVVGAIGLYQYLQ